MSYLRNGSPFLFDDVTNAIIGTRSNGVDNLIIAFGGAESVVDVTNSQDAAATINAACAAAKAVGRRSTIIRIKSAGTITLNSGVVFDPYYVYLDWQGAVTTYTPTTGVAITVTGSVTNAFTQLVGGLGQLNLRGPLTGSSIGILYTGTATGARTSSVNHNVTVYGFSVGVDFLDYGYLTDFYGLTIDSFTVAGLRQRVGTDAGENINVFGGVISNGAGIAIVGNDDTTEIFLHGVSLDYNVKVLDLSNGRIQMHGGHIEFQGTQAVTEQIKIAGQSAFRMFGGYWVVNVGTGAGPYTYGYMANLVDTNSQIILYGTHLTNHRNTADIWATGAGQFKPHDVIFFNNSLMPYQMFAGNNLMMDGGAESGAIRDFFYIQNDATGAGTTRILGASGLTWSQDTGQFRSGTKSYRLRKGNVGTTTASAGALIIPVAGQAGRRMLANVWARSDATVGVHQLSLYWGAMRKQDSIERPVWDYEPAYATNFYSALTPATWTQIGVNNGGLIVPTWATHLQLRIDITSTDALSSIWLDDISAEFV